jgi:hypothetical protein
MNLQKKESQRKYLWFLKPPWWSSSVLIDNPDQRILESVGLNLKPERDSLRLMMFVTLTKMRCIPCRQELYPILAGDISHAGRSCIPYWQEIYPMLAGVVSHAGRSCIPYWQELYPMPVGDA